MEPQDLEFVEEVKEVSYEVLDKLLKREDTPLSNLLSCDSLIPALECSYAPLIA